MAECKCDIAEKLNEMYDHSLKKIINKTPL